MSIFVTFSSLCIEYVKEQHFFISILSTIYLECLSPMNGYFITGIRTKRVFLKKNQLSMSEFQTVIANDLRSAGKFTSASRQSCGKPSFNTTIKESLKKRRMSTVPESSNNTHFDKLDHFPVFQEKQQCCRKLRTGYPFIKWQKCGVALYLQS